MVRNIEDEACFGECNAAAFDVSDETPGRRRTCRPTRDSAESDRTRGRPSKARRSAPTAECEAEKRGSIDSYAGGNPACEKARAVGISTSLHRNFLRVAGQTCTIVQHAQVVKRRNRIRPSCCVARVGVRPASCAIRKALDVLSVCIIVQARATASTRGDCPQSGFTSPPVIVNQSIEDTAKAIQNHDLIAARVDVDPRDHHELSGLVAARGDICALRRTTRPRTNLQAVDARTGHGEIVKEQQLNEFVGQARHWVVSAITHLIEVYDLARGLEDATRRCDSRRCNRNQK